MHTEKRKKPPIDYLLYPIQEFIHTEISGSLFLIGATVLALVWANSAWGESYTALWHTYVKFSIADDFFKLDKSLLHWINDGLMVVFFFVVGLEIKREVLVGELTSLRKTALPIMAALGGMVVPALIFVAFNATGEAASGWGIPMATDIAFALGILALVGSRAPLSLKVFLTALAIIDDIGAVLIIAFFYTEQVLWISLLIALGIWLLMWIANWAGVRHPLIFGILGVVLWIAFLKSGIHATVAGVLAAMTIPARTRINAEDFLKRARHYLEKFKLAQQPRTSVLTNRRQRAAVQKLETIAKAAQSPMQRLEHGLHPWVAFFIVPVFALANAGVAFSINRELFTSPVVWGIVLGLVLGKQVGVTLFAWLAVKFGLADLPTGLTWRHVYGAGWLAGIGFTMSLFVGGLAFGDGELLSQAKIGILAASVIAGGIGWLILRTTPPAIPEAEDPVLAPKSTHA